MIQILNHDPFGAYSLDDLLSVKTRSAPDDFHSFWYASYSRALAVDPRPKLTSAKSKHSQWKLFDIHFESTEGTELGGWLLVPAHGEPSRAFIVGHGYGGREGPDYHLPFTDSIIFFPCMRGISRSTQPGMSSNPAWHVLHNIDKPERYVLRGCVEDTWTAISVIEILYPQLIGKIGYLGISFGGGIGALAMAQEHRVAKAHFNVPTFGNHRLRLRIPTTGSGLAVQNFCKGDSQTALRTLRYYDAANAAEAIRMPLHFALALRDPVVTPPGQFAIYNQVKSSKQLFILDAGHAEYSRKKEQDAQLISELDAFFHF